MKRSVLLSFIMAFSALSICAQEKPWIEWDKKDVDKILNNSAWGQTQTETDTSEMVWSPTSDPRTMGSASNDSSRLASGAKNQALSVKIRIRMFSARPIREAIARTIVLGNPAVKPEQLTSFITEDYSEWIVVAVTYEATDRRMLAPVDSKFVTATLDTLKNVAYLEGTDGKRHFLTDYAAPTKDGTGAKFFFRKVVEGKPIFAPDQSFRFAADLGGGVKLAWKFKLSEMTYNGKLEY